MWYVSSMQIERTDTFIASLGLESYRVGGSVRDELLGRKPKDADYMIRGVPLIPLGVKLNDAVREFEKGAISALSLRDGRQAGWRVSGRGLGLIEIVLPRTEVAREPEPGENRHRAFDIVVDPAVTLEEDAQRRDFTFNALYKQLGTDGTSLLALPGGRVAENIIDPLGGVDDLFHRRIKVTTATGFRDDPLRTLRGLRFVSTLGYEMERETLALMTAYAEYVTGLSAKGYASGTVIDEFSKLLMGEFPSKALRLARDTGVLASIMPELSPMLGFDQSSRYHDLTTDEHTFKALETAAHVDAPLRVRWALLFHDSGKPQTAWTGDDGRKHYYGKLLPGGHPDGDPTDPVQTEDHEVMGERLWRRAASRLGAEKRLREDVALLIREHMVPIKTKNAGTRARRMRVALGDDMARDLLLHRMCDITGKTGAVTLNHLEHVAKLERLRCEAQEAGIPASPHDLAINGHDVRALGVDGRQIGDILRRVLDEVVCQPKPETMSREWQLSRAETLSRV